MKFLKSIFKRPLTICFIIIISIVAGIFSTTNMAVNLLPDISFPYLAIKTTYVGADAETVDETVTLPIEKAVSTISDIHNLSTYSVDNGSVVILQFDYGTNTDAKENEINKKLATVDLPERAGTPEIMTVDLNSTSMVTVTIFSDSDTIEDVYKDALLLKSEFNSIGGVGSVSLTGEPEQTISIKTIYGLEMFAALIVNELQIDNSLDIPLGDIETANGNITVNNTSSAKTIEEIKNLSIGVSLDSSYISMFQTAQSLLTYLEEVNSDELTDMKKNADDINAFIDEIESSTQEELEDMSNHLTTMASLISLVSNNSAPTLRLLWSSTLKNIVEDEAFLQMSDDDLHALANDLQNNSGTSFLTYDVLKWLQDNGQEDPSTPGHSYAENKWNIMCDFREAHPDDITDAEFVELFYLMDIISSDPDADNYMSQEDGEDAVALAKSINTVALQNIVNKRGNDEEVTNGDYAALFANTDYSSDIPMSATTIAFIRSEHFEENYQIFYNYKINHEHEETEYDEENASYVTTKVGDSISDEDFMSLYNQMIFEDEFALTPTEKLIHFIRSADFTSSSMIVKIDQIADVTLETKNESIAYYNSTRAIQIDVYGASGSNATAIVENVESTISSFRSKYSNCSIVMLNNQANFINDSLSNAVVSLIIGGCLAIIVIYLFLRRVKSSLIIAISMPLSILCTLVCLYLMGITLNMVSVGGLAVGIGMLVDNSIVVLESITSEREKGKDALTSALDGTKLVIGSLIGSTLTSICVFFPILFIEGLTKEIFADLSWAVMLSLSFSLLVALFIIPSLYCLLYKREDNQEAKVVKTPILNRLSNWYTNILSKLLKKKKTVILSALLLFTCSIGLAFTSSIEFLPSIDQNKIELTIQYSVSDEYSYCENKTLEAYQLIKDNFDEIDNMSLSVGYSGFIQTNRSGVIDINLKQDSKKTSEVVEDIRKLLHEQYNHDFEIQEIDGVVASLTGGMSGVSITLEGESIDTLQEIANKIENDVITKDGIKHASDNMLASAQSISITFDKQSLNEKNITYSNLVSTLRVGLAGYSTGTITIEDMDVDTIVSWQSDSIGNYYDDLAHFIVGFNNDSDPIYLEDVALIEVKNGRNVIRKSNGLNTVSIDVEVYGIDTNTASKYLQASAKEVLKDYDGYSYSSSGVSYYLTDAFTGLVIALIISFFLLFGIMACLFESLRKPIIIIFSFPFAFAGGFIALAITRVSLNVVSFIGLIMLMGVIVNDAIVLNERFDQLREDGLSPKEAVIEGCKQRLRAVLMTTLTTVLALIPMSLGQGKGGELMQPLGIVAVGGMTLGTLVTLILIPCVYSLFYKIDFNDKVVKKEKKQTKRILKKVA